MQRETPAEWSLSPAERGSAGMLDVAGGALLDAARMAIGVQDQGSIRIESTIAWSSARRSADVLA